MKKIFFAMFLFFYNISAMNNLPLCNAEEINDFEHKRINSIILRMETVRENYEVSEYCSKVIGQLAPVGSGLEHLSHAEILQYRQIFSAILYTPTPSVISMFRTKGSDHELEKARRLSEIIKNTKGTLRENLVFYMLRPTY